MLTRTSINDRTIRYMTPMNITDVYIDLFEFKTIPDVALVPEAEDKILKILLLMTMAPVFRLLSILLLTTTEKVSRILKTLLQMKVV